MAVVSSRVVILVVEDEPFIRMMAVYLLAETGRVILEADCVEEALAIISGEDRIDLLSTDINMSGEQDGLDLAKIMYRRQSDVELIITSAASNLEDNELPDHSVFHIKAVFCSHLYTSS